MLKQTVCSLSAVLLSAGAALAQVSSAPSPAPPANAAPSAPASGAPKLRLVTFLGLMARPLPAELGKQHRLPEDFGLLVEGVISGSPAEAAGIQHDDILTRLNDQKLIDLKQLAVLVRSLPADQEVTLTVLRRGEEMKITSKLTKIMANDALLSGSEKTGTHPDGSEAKSLLPPTGHVFYFKSPEAAAAPLIDLPGDGAVIELKSGVPVPEVSSDQPTVTLRGKVIESRENADGSRTVRVGPAPDQPLLAPGQTRTTTRTMRVGSARDQLTGDSPDEITVRHEMDDGSSRVTRIVPGKARVVLRDGKGELEMRTEDGKRYLTVKNPQGQIVFNGPINTEEERKAIPAEARRFDKLQQAMDLPFPEQKPPVDDGSPAKKGPGI